MSTPINTIFSTLFYLTGAVPSVTVTDDTRLNTNLGNMSGSSWYRMLTFNLTSENGTQERPWDFQGMLQNKLGGALWRVGTLDSGFTYLQYKGPTSGSITFNSTVTRNLMGFTSSSYVFSASNQVYTASHQPAFALFNASKPNDSGYMRVPGFNVSSRTGDGTVIGFRDGYFSINRSFDLQLHPYDYRTRISNSLLATQMYPENPANSFGATNPHTYSPPYSVWQFMDDAPYKSNVMILGCLVDLLNGRGGNIDVGYLSPNTVGQQTNPVPLIKDFRKFWNWNKVEVSVSQSIKVNPS